MIPLAQLKSKFVAFTAIAAFTAGVVAGSWTVWKFVKAAQIDALEAQLALERENKIESIGALKRLHAKQLAMVKGRVEFREVIKHVKDDSACDIPVPVVRVLENYRQGRVSREATPRAGDTTAATQAPLAVSQRQELEGHRELAELYHQCRNQLIEIKRLVYGDDR